MFKIFNEDERLYEKGVYEVTYELSDSINRLKVVIENDVDFTFNEMLSYLKKEISNLDMNKERINLKKTKIELSTKRRF